MHAERTYACEQCDKRFGSEQLLGIHLKRTHADKKYTCKCCDYRTTNPANLRRHHECLHAEKTFSCGTSDAKFGGKKHLELHLNRTHAAKKHPCKLCDYQATSPASLRRHSEAKHTEKQFTCGSCGAKFGAQKLLEGHAKQVHATDKKYSCEHCHYQTSQISHLRSHFERKHVEKKFACGTCNAKFGGQNSLEMHAKYVHGLNAEKWHCETCGKDFTSRTHLNTHVLVHAAKSLKCDKCEKLFATQKQLTMHANMHEGIYACDKCNRPFSCATALAGHVRAVHKKEKFHCKGCGKAFSDPGRLKEHYRLNHAKDLPCTYGGCGFVGTDYKAFEDHLVEVHDELRAQKCSVCDQWFSSKTNLKAHLTSVHNGVYRYNCWCGFTTNVKTYFEAHEAKDDCAPKQLMLSNFGMLGKAAKNGNLMADYVLEGDVLGRGNNGVYRARRKVDPEKAWTHAVKRIRVDSRDHYAKALTEVQLMLKFNHQNLMSAKAVYTNGEYVSIVMDLVRPGSLSHVIKAVSQRTLGFAEVAVAAVIKGATQGLVFLHSKGIMHRDMKSDNVLVDENGVAKLPISAKQRPTDLQGT